MKTLVFLLHAACLLPLGTCYCVDWAPFATTVSNLTDNPQVTNWLLTPRTTNNRNGTGIPNDRQRAAWRRVGAKVWTILSKMDHDYLTAEGKPAPSGLQGTSRVYGPTVSCGRIARQLIRLPFHDCGTFDIGNTGSEGDTGSPRFGCNGSLRKEVAPCTSGEPACVFGVEAAINMTTGDPVTVNGAAVHAFDQIKAKFNLNGSAADKLDWSQPTPGTDNQRMESSGFANNLALLYQLLFEAQTEGLPTATYADILMYAGMLAVAKCKGPQIEFQPGRRDETAEDAPHRLPDPTESVNGNAAYFWTNGVTNQDMVNLLAAHSVGCFKMGCQDETPSGYDANWARKLLSLMGGTDANICQFDTAGNQPAAVRQMCFLPSDANFAGRADTRRYLEALADTSNADVFTKIAAIPYSPFSPVGACPGTDCRKAPWVPFEIFVLANMCNRGDVGLRIGCDNNVLEDQKNFNDAVSTSYFKMSKWYPTNINGGSVAHANFHVRPQPCQPGLHKVGKVPDDTPGACTCCPHHAPLPFCWQYTPPAAGVVNTKASAATAAAATATGPVLDIEGNPFPVRFNGGAAAPATLNPASAVVPAAATASGGDGSALINQQAEVVAPAAEVIAPTFGVVMP